MLIVTLVDMMAFAMDNPANAKVTIILITNDHGYVYPMNILRARRYRVIVIATPGACAGLRYQEEDYLNWDEEVVDNIRRPKPVKLTCDTIQSPIGSLSSTPTVGRPRSFTASTNEGSIVNLPVSGSQIASVPSMNPAGLRPTSRSAASSPCDNSRRNSLGSFPADKALVPQESVLAGPVAFNDPVGFSSIKLSCRAIDTR